MGKIKNGTSTNCFKIRKKIYEASICDEERSTLKPNHKGNSEHLHKLMAKLTGGVSVNPMPDGNLDVELANDFANFFRNKIVKVRNKLDETLECFFLSKNRSLVLTE